MFVLSRTTPEDIDCRMALSQSGTVGDHGLGTAPFRGAGNPARHLAKVLERHERAKGRGAEPHPNSVERGGLQIRPARYYRDRLRSLRGNPGGSGLFPISASTVCA